MKILLTLVALAGVCLADTVTPTGWNNHVYDAILVSGNTSIPLQMVCIDFTRPGPALDAPYNATVSTFNDLSATRRPDLVANYVAVTWLYEQILNPANNAEVFRIQQAMWGLITPGYGVNPSINPWAVNALDATRTGWNTTPYAVITPTNTNTQEMITKLGNSLTAVPEPGCLLLLGSGLAGMASLLRKRKPTR